MDEMHFNLNNFFQKEDAIELSSEDELEKIEYCCINNICININNMTSSSINLGSIRSNPPNTNNNSDSSKTLNLNSETKKKPSQVQASKNKKHKRNKSQNTTLKVTFPGMIQKKHGSK